MHIPTSTRVEALPRPEPAMFASDPPTQCVIPQGMKHITPPRSFSIRCTVGAIPATPALAQRWPIPIALVVQPLAPGPSPIPLVDFQTQSLPIPRCRSRVCRSYVNPFVSWTADGRSMLCNLCWTQTENPPQYRAPVDTVSGIRTDATSRPELHSASVEFVATREYSVRPPQRPSLVFVFDVSKSAVQSGFLVAASVAAAKALDSIPEDDQDTVVAFILFASVPYIVVVPPGASRVRLVSAPQLPALLQQLDSGSQTNTSRSFLDALLGGPAQDEPQAHPADLPEGPRFSSVPLPAPPTQILVPLHESRPLMEEFLEELPSMFEDTDDSGCAFGAALILALRTMLSLPDASGGKLIAFLSTSPNIPPGRITRRPPIPSSASQLNQSTSADSKGKPADSQNAPDPTLTPDPQASPWYYKRALVASREHICIDLFTLGPDYVPDDELLRSQRSRKDPSTQGPTSPTSPSHTRTDLSTLHCLSRITAGTCRCYRSFSPDDGRLSADVLRLLHTWHGLEAVMRVRVGRGLSVRSNGFHGNFLLRNGDLMQLPNAHTDRAFVVEVSVTAPITTTVVPVQVALLYTDRRRRRLIRIHTLNLPVTQSFTTLVESADTHAIATMLAKSVSGYDDISTWNHDVCWIVSDPSTPGITLPGYSHPPHPQPTAS